MQSSNYSTNRRLVSGRPKFFDQSQNGLPTLRKVPDSSRKIAEGGLRLTGKYKTGSDKKPLVTVITVVFNGVDFLEETMKSVFNQDYDNVEYIIIDGGSADGTQDVIRQYEGSIDYWVSEPDSGIYNAMNKAVTVASGCYLSFLNCGDLFFDERTLSSVFGGDRADIIYGDSVVFDGDFEICQKSKVFSQLSLFFWGTRVVCHQAIFIARAAFEFYDEELRLKSELKWYICLARKNKSVLQLDFPVCKYALGGLSDRYFKKEMEETVLVMFGANPLFALLHAPVFIYKLIKRFLS